MREIEHICLNVFIIIQVERLEVHLHIEEGSFQLKNEAPSAEASLENLAILLFVFNDLRIDLGTVTNYSSIKVRQPAILFNWLVLALAKDTYEPHSLHLMTTD